MTDVYEFSEYRREDLIYHFSNLTPEEALQKKLNYQKFEEEKARQKAAQTAAANPQSKQDSGNQN
jgi:NADH-quinone oxidoreductase subunit I